MTICALLALGHSLWFAWRYFQPCPWLDMWDEIAAFPKLTQGTYGLHDLIAQHNDHRIATARLFFLADLSLFRMTGRFVSIANLVLLGLLGLVLHRLWRAPVLRGTAADLPPLFFAALMMSVCQWENLVTPFQIQFALLGLWSAISVCFLAAATVPGARPARAAALTLGAAVTFLLAAFSMAGGILLMPALLALLFLRRATPWIAGLFAVCACAVLLLFFHGYQHAALNPPAGPFVTQFLGLLRPAMLAAFPPVFLGTAVAGLGWWAALAAGITGLVSLAALSWAAIRRWPRPLPARASCLLVLAAFCVLNACAAARLRFQLAPDAAAASRYSLLSMIFWVGIAGAALQAACAGHRRDGVVTRSPLVPALAIVGLITLNISPENAQRAANLRQLLVIAGTTLRAGVFAPGLLQILNPFSLDGLRPSIGYLHRNGLGPFAGSNAPPDAVRARLASLDVAHLPACIGTVDWFYRLDASRAVLRAWLASPDGKHTAAWVTVSQGDGTIVATLPAQEARDFLPLAPKHTAAFGVLAAMTATIGDGPTTLVGLFPGSGACRLPTPGPGPVRIQPIGPKPGAVQMAALLGPVQTGGAFAASHAGPAAPWSGASIWSSANAAARGSMHMRIAAPDDASVGLIVPVTAGPDAYGQSLTFVLADGARIDFPIPADTRGAWRAAALPAAVLRQHRGPIEIILNDQGDQPDQWSAIVAPYAAKLDPNAARLPN